MGVISQPYGWPIGHVHHKSPVVVECYDETTPMSDVSPLLTDCQQTSSLGYTHSKSWLFPYPTKALMHLKSLPKKAFGLLLGCVFVLVLFLTVSHTGNGFQFSLIPWNSDLEQRLPQAIIVGVRKCGTRAVLEFLSQHPSVCHAHDEMHFFNNDERYSLGLQWYRQQMPYSHANQITMEKTPGYFIARHAPSLIKNMNSSIKLVMIVRDPVTRVVSDYTQTLTNHLRRNESFTSFESLVIDPNTGEINTLYKPIWISLYYLHYMHWIDIFNQSQIHLVDGDSLVENPVPELTKLETFLGIDHVINDDYFYFNKTRGFYCLKKGYDSRCLSPSKGRTHPDVKPRIIHKLYRFFKPFNEKFYKLSGQYFDWTQEKSKRRSRAVE